MTVADDALQALLSRCQQDHQSWINGDGSPYVLPDDGTIMGAVGGYNLGGAETAERRAAVARQWRSGTGDIEFVNGGASDDLAWLVMIERATVVVDPERGKQRWDVCVTEVFRRINDSWERVHRHADPLVDRRTATDAASLLQ